MVPSEIYYNLHFRSPCITIFLFFHVLKLFQMILNDFKWFQMISNEYFGTWERLTWPSFYIIELKTLQLTYLLLHLKSFNCMFLIECLLFPVPSSLLSPFQAPISIFHFSYLFPLTFPSNTFFWPTIVSLLLLCLSLSTTF